MFYNSNEKIKYLDSHCKIPQNVRSTDPPVRFSDVLLNVYIFEMFYIEMIAFKTSIKTPIKISIKTSIKPSSTKTTLIVNRNKILYRISLHMGQYREDKMYPTL